MHQCTSAGSLCEEKRNKRIVQRARGPCVVSFRRIRPLRFLLQLLRRRVGVPRRGNCTRQSKEIEIVAKKQREREIPQKWSWPHHLAQQPTFLKNEHVWLIDSYAHPFAPSFPPSPQHPSINEQLMRFLSKNNVCITFKPTTPWRPTHTTTRPRTICDEERRDTYNHVEAGKLRNIMSPPNWHTSRAVVSSNAENHHPSRITDRSWCGMYKYQYRHTRDKTARTAKQCTHDTMSYRVVLLRRVRHLWSDCLMGTQLASSRRSSRCWGRRPKAAPDSLAHPAAAAAASSASAVHYQRRRRCWCCFAAASYDPLSTWASMSCPQAFAQAAQLRGSRKRANLAPAVAVTMALN